MSEKLEFDAHLKESNIKVMRETLEQIDKVVFDKRRHTTEIENEQ